MKKIALFALAAFAALAAAAPASAVDKHFNNAYTTGAAPVPQNLNDRYYSQDLGRDAWYAIEQAGLLLKDLSGLGAFIVSGGTVSQTAATNRISVSSGAAWVPFRITVPNSYASLPPSTTTNDVALVRVTWPAISGFDISTQAFPAQFNQTNYVKVAYFEASAATRTYALKVGTYTYAVAPYFQLTVDTVAPTAYQALLATIVSTGTAGTMTISTTSNTPSTFRRIQVAAISNVDSLTFSQGSSVTAVATPAQMTAGNSSTTIVTPANIIYGRGTGTAWALFTGTGTSTIQAGWGVASVSNLGGGNYDVTFSPPFSDKLFAMNCTATFQTGVANNICEEDPAAARTTTSIRIKVVKSSDESGQSPDKINIQVIGNR